MRRCSPVIEVDSVRLADDGADEGGQENSSGCEGELHGECK